MSVPSTESFKQYVKSISKRAAYLKATEMSDRLICSYIKIRNHRFNAPNESYHVLLPTLGRGNIGDQAMFESFIANCPGEIVAVTTSDQDLDLPNEFADRVKIVPLTKLILGTYKGRFRDRLRFYSLLSRAKSFSVIGADIMDGAYARRESVLRSQLLLAAQQFSVPSRVVGFSWSPSPDTVATNYLRRVSRKTRLMSRDIRSHERMTQAGINSMLVTDTVFSFKQTMAPPFLSGWQASQDRRRTVIINTSGLIARTTDLSGQYVELIRELLSTNYRIILLPHVLRSGDSDLEVSRNIYNNFRSNPNIYLVESKLQPAEVSAVVSDASLVITGRMHLAIISLLNGVPPIILSTQGKVEGLLDLFDLVSLAVKPSENPSFAKEIRAAVNLCLTNEAVLRENIVSRLPHVISVSKENFLNI